MSWFTDVNTDAHTVSPDIAAVGPRVGFLRAFQTSYESQVRGASLYGVQEAMRNREDKQRQALREAGVENIPSISQQADDPMRLFTDFGQDYWDAAQFYEKGGDPKINVRLAEYDKRVNELKKQYPQLDLQTSLEMWKSVRDEAQYYERMASTERQDFGGVIGGFIGGAVGALNPNTDPLNFVTLPLGGVGKTFVSRIAMQAGAQGLIETGNQLLGVQEQRRLQGLGYGPADAMTRIAGAAIGGAAVQGVGEALGYGFRKLFRNTKVDPVPDVALPPPPPRAEPAREGTVPEDPATVAATYAERPQAFYDFMNEVNPYRKTRLGKARMVDDMTHAEAQLNAWDGPPPWSMPPKTDTAQTLSLGYFTKQPDISESAMRGDLDAMARRVDPETFRKYDAFADAKAVARDNLAGLTGLRNEYGANKRIVELTDQLQTIDDKIARASAKNRKRLGKEREAVIAEREAEIARFKSTDTPAMAEMRRQVMDADEKMRDLAELIGRAYARARERWAATQGERKAIMRMVREGSKRIGPTIESEALVDAAMARQAVADTIPVLAERPADMPTSADVADVQMRVYADRTAVADERAATFSSNAARVLKQAEAYAELDKAGKAAALAKLQPGELRPDQFVIDGYKDPVSLDDRIEVEDDVTGDITSITVRDMLQRQVDADEDLKAVTTCSLK